MNRRVGESVHRRWAPLGKRALRKLTIVWVLLLAIAFTGLWYRLRHEDTMGHASTHRGGSTCQE
jgi:hypothetical protein